jgi:WD40 repeat protein
MTLNQSGWQANGFGPWLVLAASAACAAAQEAKPGKAVQDYARAIAQAQADLDAGRVAEGRQRLEATDKSLRNFEYHYLHARAQAADPQGAAPDLVRTIAMPKEQSRYEVLNESDRQVAFICRDGSVRVHDLTAPDAPPKVTSHPVKAPIWSGAFSHDGKTFAAGHANGEVMVWDAKTWTVRLSVKLGAQSPVRELAIAPDGTALVAEGKTALELWSLVGDRPKKVADVGDRYNFGEGLAFSPKGDLVATGGMFDVVLYDAKTGARAKTIRHASYTMGLAFSPDGKRVASAPRGNVNRFLSLFDVAEGKAVFDAGPFDNYVAGLAFTPDGQRVVATGPQNDVRLFDATTGEIVLTLKRASRTVKPAVAHDGRLLGWSQADGYRFIDLGKAPDAGK